MSSNTSTDDMSSSVIQSETEFWAHTKSSTFKLKFNWKIDNFSFYLENNPTQFTAIISPDYSAPGHEDVRFNLGLYPNNHKKEDKEYLALYLHCTTLPSPIIVKWKMSFVDKESKDQHSRNGQCKFTENTGLGFAKMLDRSVLLEPKNGLLPDDQLTIRCEATICIKRDDSSAISEMISIQTLGSNSREYDDELILSIAQVLENTKHSDVTLFVDGIELQAHKVILSVRSPVFDAMFSHENTKEAREGKVEIEDVSKDTFKDLLQFIYTGKVPEKERLTIELLAASDKYQVNSLKSACEINLSTSLSIESAASVLLIADMHAADKLKLNAINFIAANIFKVMATDAWMNMAKVRPELMREIGNKTAQEEWIESFQEASSEEEA